jgi:hypothetical protein
MERDDSEVAEGTPPEDFAREVRVEEIAGTEGWVGLIGTVINRNVSDSSFLMDDGTGQITAKASKMPELGTLVRVVGRVFTADGKPAVDGVIVQDFSSFDVELYRRIRDLEGRVFSQEEDCHR